MLEFSFYLEKGQPNHSSVKLNWLESRKPTSGTFSNFQSKCYKCGGIDHTLKFCPLQRCNICSQFGHHEKACPTLFNSHRHRKNRFSNLRS